MTLVRLVRAEWLKLTRRPLTRVLLGVFLGLLALQAAAYALMVFADSFGVLHMSDAFGPAQVEEYRRRVVFPGVLGAAFGHINGLGGVFAVVLAGAAMGSEYDWGTLRTQLARTPGRCTYLLAKLTALLLLLLAGTVVTVAFGLGLGCVLGRLVGSAAAPDAATLAHIPLAVLCAVYVLLPYVLIAVCLATMRRSLLFGVAGGLMYLAFEAGFGAVAIFSALGEPWRSLYGLTIGQNINALTALNGRAFGLQPEVLAPGLRSELLPSVSQATVAVAVYCLLLVATAARLLRRDVTPAN
jgi:ABC-type transport system involved in multi-copper enzyme maturation permease subunit